MLLKTVFSTGFVATLAAATNAHGLEKRGGWDPEDQSGDSQVYFSCDTHTYPNPGIPKSIRD